MRPRRPTSLRPLMTVNEVAEFLHVHTQTVRKLIQTSDIPAFRVGTDWRIRRDEVDKWIAEKTQLTS